jgi:hypothetical protein
MMTKSIVRLYLPLIFLVLTGLLPKGTQAQTLTLKPEIRPRTEYRHGFKSLVPTQARPAMFTEQRSRISALFADRYMQSSLVVQDIRIWGAAPQLNKSDAMLSVHEAWASYAWASRWNLKVGRQEVMYDHRIFGNVDWAQQGRSHDAALLQYTDSAWAMHMGVAYNQDASILEPTKLMDNYYDGTANTYKAMQFLWFHQDFSKGAFSVYAINNGMQAKDTTVKFSQTLGTIGYRNMGNLKAEWALFYQMGRDVANRAISAYMGSLFANYTHQKAQIGLGADLLSGTALGTASNHSFDPLWGTHHKFYGLMDYFYVGNPHAQAGQALPVGLLDNYLKTSFTSTKAGQFHLHVHGFMSPVALGGASQAFAYLGTELDFFHVISLSDHLGLQWGYSHMLATTQMEYLKPLGLRTATNNWAWAMLSFKPSYTIKFQ